MSRRHPPVEETRAPSQGRVHSADCDCGEDACLARRVKDVSAIDAPGLARCEEDDGLRRALDLLRGPDDEDVTAARRGGRR